MIDRGDATRMTGGNISINTNARVINIMEQGMTAQSYKWKEEKTEMKPPRSEVIF